MITFKDLKHKIESSKLKKAGLDHPVHDDRKFENEPKIGKELNSVPIPLKVHDEIKGPQGNHKLEIKNGKYNIEKN